MEITINFKFKKIITFAAFIILMVKAGVSIAVMANLNVDSESLDGIFTIVRDFIDVALWVIIAQWFLHIYLYMSKIIGRSSLRHSTSVTIFFAMVKCLSACLFTLYYENYSVWTVVYTVIEIILWIICFVYILKVWAKVSGMSHKSEKNHSYYSLADEIARKGLHSNPYK